MAAQTEPDPGTYLGPTESGELIWELHGVIYEARHDGQILTFRRENRSLILTRRSESALGTTDTMRSSDAGEGEREKWEQLMALVETHAI